MTEQAEGELDKVVTGTGTLQQGAKQHEQEHEAGGDAKGNAEHPFGGDPLVVGQRGKAYPAMCQQPRHPGARQAVDQKDDSDDRQCRPQGAARRFQQQRNADAGGHQIGGGEGAGTQRQCFIHHKQVRRGASSDQAEGDITEGNPIPRRGAKCREHQKSQQQSKGEVNGAGFGVIEYAKPHHEGEWRGDPELEQGPGQRQCCDEPAHDAQRQASAHILGDQFLGRELFILHRVNLCQRVQQERHPPPQSGGRRVSKRVTKAPGPSIRASRALCSSGQPLHAAVQRDPP